MALEKIVSGALQGLFAGADRLPARGGRAGQRRAPPLQVHWPVLLTLVPLACLTAPALGLTFGTRFQPRQVPLLFGVIDPPLTFLGGTYYPWTTLEAVKVGGFAGCRCWCCSTRSIYMTEGFRAALTSAHHMHLYVIYPALVAFLAVFLFLGIKGFRTPRSSAESGMPRAGALLIGTVRFLVAPRADGRRGSGASPVGEGSCVHAQFP